jgi:hypothetical protein
MRRALPMMVLVMTSCGAAPQSRLMDPLARSPARSGDSVVLASATTRASAPAQPTDRPQRRMVVKVANLELITKDPDGAFDKAVAVAKEMDGYTVTSSHGDRRSSVTLRVPAARFEEAVRRVCALGKVDRREVTGTDVTAEFVDMTIRLANAARARQRYLELLAKSASVTEALSVQRELERITGTIEQLRGQLDLMQHQVSMSTINLTLEKPVRPGPIGWIFYGLYHGIRWLFVWN